MVSVPPQRLPTYSLALHIEHVRQTVLCVWLHSEAANSPRGHSEHREQIRSCLRARATASYSLYAHWEAVLHCRFVQGSGVTVSYSLPSAHSVHGVHTWPVAPQS